MICRKKFIKTSPEWHDLLDFIGKDWQFDCPSGQHAEQHPSLISLVFRLIGNCSDQSYWVRISWRTMSFLRFTVRSTCHEIAKTEVSCIPYGSSPKTLGGDFIQEGADNIDLNTETIE
jgi:hypothetical protein